MAESELVAKFQQEYRKEKARADNAEDALAARDEAIGELVKKVEQIVTGSRERLTHVSVDVSEFDDLKAALAAYKAVQP